MRGRKRNPWLIPLLAVLLPVGAVLAVCVGKYPVTPWESLGVLWGALTGGGSADQMTANVVLGLRVPRILASILVGAALSVSGTAYQGVFQNPLISPDFLGVSGGACVGAAAAILLSLTSGWVQLFAFAGGLLAVGLTVTLPMLLRSRANLMLVLSGIIVGSAMSSLLGFLKYTADPETQLAAITYWTMGGFNYLALEDLLPWSEDDEEGIALAKEILTELDVPEEDWPPFQLDVLEDWPDSSPCLSWHGNIREEDPRDQLVILYLPESKTLWVLESFV